MPKIPRKLKRNEEEDSRSVYEWSADFCARPHRRPLPSSNQMILTVTAGAVAEADRELPPLLKSFLSAIGHDAARGDKGQVTGDANNRGEGDDAFLATIDNPKHSTLTLGQHQRYEKLLTTSKQTWNSFQHKEFKKLNTLVQTEQSLYQQALVEFWEGNKDRLMVGFSRSSSSSPASRFVELAANFSSETKAWRDCLKDAKYGKCRQVISLESTLAGAGIGNNKQITTWTIDGISSQKVSSGHNNEKGERTLMRLPAVGTPITCPKARKSTARLLESDETALKIAQSNKIPLIATLEALENMLDAEGNQWNIPVNFVKGIAMVESPLPRSFPNPRACLSSGLDQGLAQWSELHGNQEEIDSNKHEFYRYVILSVPQVTSSTGRINAKQTKVLVRLPQQTTRAHAHVEYFSERGEEIASPMERSLWILDHHLFAKSLVCRVDPKSCKVLKWEETSVAHALARTETTTTTQNAFVPRTCIDHWHGLAQILQAIPGIGRKGRFLLCLPGRGLNLAARSVSVHMEETKSGDETSSILDLEADLSRAGEVQMGTEAIRGCIRKWVWNHVRVRDTFPVPNTSKPRL